MAGTAKPSPGFVLASKAHVSAYELPDPDCLLFNSALPEPDIVYGYWIRNPKWG